MTERTYPYKAWVLQPLFKPIEIELVSRAWIKPWGWDMSTTHKAYDTKKMYPTKQSAINAGWDRVTWAQADLDKRATNLEKKRIALRKAEQA